MLALVACCDRLVLNRFVLSSVTDDDKAVVDDLVRVTKVEGGYETLVDCSVVIWPVPVIREDVTVVVGSSVVLWLVLT